MFNEIVVGTDGSSRSETAVRVAAGLAASSGARLHLVRAFRLTSNLAAALGPAEMGVAMLQSDDDIADQVSQEVDRLAEDLRKDGITVEIHAGPGGAADSLLDVADRYKADLVVVGNKGMHGARRMLGSIPNTIAHHATCAVLIVPTGG